MAVTFRGGAGVDIFNGSALAELFLGLDGKDTINGGAGATI